MTSDDLKFKSGDRVYYVSGNHGVGLGNPLKGSYEFDDVAGTVRDIEQEYGTIWIQVDWDNNNSNSYHPEDLCFVSDFVKDHQDATDATKDQKSASTTLNLPRVAMWRLSQ